jgi:hypothetical protein
LTPLVISLNRHKVQQICWNTSDRNFYANRDFFSIFTLWTFLLYVRTLQQHLHVELIRYFRVCRSNHYLLNRELPLARKLLYQWLLVFKLTSSIGTFYGCHHDLVNRYICVTVICSIRRSLNPVVPILRIFNKSNTTGATGRKTTVYPSGIHPQLLVLLNLQFSV